MAITPSPTRVHFQKEHVIVKYPGHAGKIQVVRLILPSIKSLPALPGGFHPSRLVINLKLVETAHPETKMLTLDPPVEVRVRYNVGDFADPDGNIHMAYWDGSKWIPFTKAGHKFHLEGWNAAEGRGWAVVFLTEWGDPPIAIGT